ncbi:MAG TPA: serine/threonine-protein kinase [Kofleriaceae bacterium]|nr:serine/threonine-protein kinase [Kofleriaceae bacterium]
MDELDPDRTKVSVVDPLVGSELDRRYRIEFRLAAGGFGAIYRATHVINRRAVALKVLHTSLASEADVVARFRREAQALGALRNPHTVMAYDFGETADGTLYIAMELLQGESLFERFRALGPLPWRRMLAIVEQVCSSLAEAHAIGIVHRDLKPTNIHLEEVGGDPDYVKVLDFGIAKILHGSTLDSIELTRSGQMIGTFDYMAPEQMFGGAVSPRCDIYTLGVLMYEMISGDKPYGDPESPAAMMQAIVTRKVPPLSTVSDAPAALDAVVMRCLEREAAKRYPSVSALADDIDRVLSDDDTKTDARMSFGDDTATAIDKAPEPRDTVETMDAVDPRTTLPGIAPPERNTPWPLSPRRK